MELIKRLLPHSTDYDVVEKLGDGFQGVSYKLKKSNSNHLYVLKLIECRDRYQAEIFFKEILLIRRFNHKRLTRVQDVFIKMDSCTSAIYLLVLRPFVEFNSLSNHLSMHIKKKGFEKEFTYSVFGSIMDLLLKLKACGYFHMNLHPNNIFVEGNQVFFTDIWCPNLLYYSRNSKQSFEHLYDLDLIETLPIECPSEPANKKCRPKHIEWCPPEMADGEFNDRSDLWTLACVTKIMLHIKQVDATQLNQLPIQIKSNPQECFPVTTKITEGDEAFHLLLLQMLQPDPKLRISLEELEKHPIVRRILETTDPDLLDRAERCSVTTESRPIPGDLGEGAVRDYLLHNWPYEKCAEAAVVWFAENVCHEKSWLPSHLPPVLFCILKLHKENDRVVEGTFDVLRHATRLGQEVTNLKIHNQSYHFECTNPVACGLSEDWKNEDLLTILDAMRQHPMNINVQRSGLQLFDSLLQSLNVNVSIEAVQNCLKSRNHIFSYLKRIGMTSHTLQLLQSTSFELAALGVEYLWKWCIYPPNAHVMAQTNAFEVVLHLMQTYPDEIRLFTNGPLLLLSFSTVDYYYPPKSVADDIVPVFLEGLRDFTNCPDTIWSLCAGLQVVINFSECFALQFMGIPDEPKYSMEGFNILYTIYKMYFNNTHVLEAIMRVITAVMQYRPFCRILCRTEKAGMNEVILHWIERLFSDSCCEKTTKNKTLQISLINRLSFCLH